MSDYDKAEDFIRYWYTEAGLKEPEAISQKHSAETMYRVAIERLAFTYKETVAKYKEALDDMVQLKMAGTEKYADAPVVHTHKYRTVPSHEYKFIDRFTFQSEWPNKPGFLGGEDE